MTKVPPRTCLLEFENGTGPIHQKLLWNGQRDTLQGSLPGGVLQLRRLIVQTEAGHFEVLGSELEWHCGARESETRRPDAVRSGPLYFTGEEQSVRLWVRVPTPLAPFTDNKRPGDYVVVLVVLGNLDTNHLEASPLAVAAVDERAWDKPTETNYALCPLPTPNQSDIWVALPPRGCPSPAWGADSTFEQAFGDRPDGGLFAIWRRTVGGDGATLYRLHLSRTFCSVPGSDDPSLAVGGRVAWEQVPNDDGDAAGVGGRWHLRPMSFADRELLEWAQERAWRGLLRTLFGRLETQRTFLFELLPTVGETGWWPAYDLLPDGGASARRPFTFVERLPAWREPRKSRLRFPSVRDWTGEPLCAEATIAAAVDGRRHTRFELRSVRIEPPARVRAGSLDLRLAGREGSSSTGPGPPGTHRRHRAPYARPRPPGRNRPHAPIPGPIPPRSRRASTPLLRRDRPATATSPHTVTPQRHLRRQRPLPQPAVPGTPTDRPPPRSARAPRATGFRAAGGSVSERPEQLRCFRKSQMPGRPPESRRFGPPSIPAP